MKYLKNIFLIMIFTVGVAKAGLSDLFCTKIDYSNFAMTVAFSQIKGYLNNQGYMPWATYKGYSSWQGIVTSTLALITAMALWDFALFPRFQVKIEDNKENEDYGRGGLAFTAKFARTFCYFAFYNTVDHIMGNVLYHGILKGPQ